MRVGYAIVFVSDMRRSVAFYREVVGLPLRFESPEWTEFATQGATLALHGSRTPPAARDASRTSPPGHCQPGIGVPDIEAFHARMVAHGVPCLQPPTDLHGTRLASYVDPDGLTLSVSEAHEREGPPL